MNEQTLDHYLRLYTAEEKNHLQGMYKDYSELPIAGYYHNQPCYHFYYNPEDFLQTLSQKKILTEYYNFAVIKQDRFEEVPLHIHDWIELIYVYSGRCLLTINDTLTEITTGQMVLINTDTPHSISRCKENDILINFLIAKEYLNTAFFERLAKDNYLINFFIDTLNNQANHNNYIIFKTNEKRLTSFANQFLCEFYSPSIASSHILDSLMTLIVCELINIFEHNLELKSPKADSIYSIIRYIEMNYANSTLESTAHFFNMHPNYFSTYVKKHTGISYKEMIQTQRLQQAAYLLRTTYLTTCDISYHVGYQNTSFFFQKFKVKYGCTPNEYRKIHGLYK